MTKIANICPECKEKNKEEFIRCVNCNAFLLDNSPWKTDSNLYAIVGTLIVWLILLAASLVFDISDYQIGNDAISQGILFVAVYGLFVVVFKWQTLIRQIESFKIVRKFCDIQSNLNDELLQEIRHAIKEAKRGPYNNLIGYQRLYWIINTMQGASPFNANILETMKQQAETDRESLESSLYLVQFLIWLLPTVGFLGTVVGMTQALHSFSAVVAQGSDLGFTAGLTATAQGLGVAFHTTLVGLAAVIPLFAVTTSLRRNSQLFLEQLDKFFLRLVANLQIEPEDEENEDPSGNNPEDEILSLAADVEEPDFKEMDDLTDNEGLEDNDDLEDDDDLEDNADLKNSGDTPEPFDWVKI